MTQTHQQYATEQQKLREKYGLDEDDNLPENVLVPDVNPEVYKDVEPLLFQGFVTTSATIQGLSFVFKSLNHHEFGRMNMILKPVDPLGYHKYHSLFLAYGVLFVDGVNVLKNRDDQLQDLSNFFENVHKEVRQKVILHLSELNRRATRAVILTEAYSIESRSRLRWTQVRGLDLTSTSVTGFEGTTTLGLNWGQLTWRALNNIEDSKEVAEREWENAKFVASSMAGKGMSRIYSQDKRRRRGELEERVARRERLIRYALLNEPLEGAPRGPVKVARTVGELVAQMERDLSGEQDWHDKVIEAHERRLQDSYDDRMSQVQMARERHLEEFGDHAIIASTDVRQGLTPQEVKKRLQERQSTIAASLEAKQKFIELTDPKMAQFSQKWRQKSSSELPRNVIPAQDPQRQKSRPFNGGKS